MHAVFMRSYSETIWNICSLYGPYTQTHTYTIIMHQLHSEMKVPTGVRSAIEFKKRVLRVHPHK